MPRPLALTAEQRTKAVGLLATGTSAREVARRFGVDHKIITRLRGSTLSASAHTSQRSAATAAHDAFEAAQLAMLDLIDDKLAEVKKDATGADVPAVSARDLAGLVKAKNDTIKALRAHSAMSQATSPEDDDGVAELVMARLQRLQEVGRSVAPVTESTTEEPTSKNGTDQ